MTCSECTTGPPIVINRPVVGPVSSVQGTAPIVVAPTTGNSIVSITPGTIPGQALVTNPTETGVEWGPVLIVGTQLVPLTAGTNGVVTGSTRQRWMRVGDFVQGHGTGAVGVASITDDGLITMPIPYPVLSGTTPCGTLIGNFNNQMKIGHSIGGPNANTLEFSITADYTAVDVCSYTFGYLAAPIAP